MSKFGKSCGKFFKFYAQFEVLCMKRFMFLLRDSIHGDHISQIIGCGDFKISFIVSKAAGFDELAPRALLKANKLNHPWCPHIRRDTYTTT